MKHFFMAVATIATLFSATAFAQNNRPLTTLHGVIELETHWTMTCMAIGCPPSTSYQQAILNVGVNGGQKRIVLVPMTFPMPIDANQTEHFYGQIRISHGLPVRVTGVYNADIEMMTAITRIDVLGQRQLTSLLEYDNLAISYSNQEQAAGFKIVVQADGRVIRTNYFGRQPVVSQQVGQLTANDIRTMQNLLQQSQAAITQLPDLNTPVCLAMPTHNVRIAGLNGQVLLLEGAFPCGRSTRNTSPAATRLVQWIQSLSQAPVATR